MRQPEIDTARHQFEREKCEQLLALADDPTAIDAATDNIGVRLVNGDDPADPMMAEILANAKPGCEVEAMRLCGALQDDLGMPDPAWQHE